jgi:hypothetical protein
MNASFDPSGKWFVFNESTGQTIRRNLKDAYTAFDWIQRERVRTTKQG